MTKTTILGILTIVTAIANAALMFLKSGTTDIGGVIVAVTAGLGLIKAADAPK
jgi:hypothetical protein